MSERAPWLDSINAAWRLSPIDGLWERVPSRPFDQRPCGRIDAHFRQHPDLTPNEIEALIVEDNMRQTSR